MTKVHIEVTKMISECLELWENTDIEFDSLLVSYTKKQKRQKAKLIKISINNVMSSMENIPKAEDERALWQNNLKTALISQAKILLEINNPALEKIVLEGFMDVADSFVNGVKEFDPKIKMIDIMQAMRNVWIMNLIQVMANREVKYTPSIFAYSMLYPYTDNFLDDKSNDETSKQQFNKRLGKRLAGDLLKPNNKHEQKVFSLIKMIEDQYDRAKYPKVFESIICIHEAQCKSLIQQKENISEKELLSISCEKGGTSVLADAYLVCADLDESLAQMMFRFGFLLQLIDDLQDVDEDICDGSLTTFVLETKKGKLDNITKKLIALTYTSLNFESLHSPHMDSLKPLVLSNCLFMILEAISKNSRYFTKEFLRASEEYSPIYFSQFKKIKKLIAKRTEGMDMDMDSF